MSKTTNYGLHKYAADEKFAITSEKDSLNHNMDLIDAAMSSIDKKIDTVSSTTSEFNELTSQGRNAKYNITSSGWKRVLNIIRTSNGTINFGLSASSDPIRMAYILAIDFSGFVKFPNDNSTSKPILLKRYENIFGNDESTSIPAVKISAVRIGYPDPTQTPWEYDGCSPENPVKCYLDIYVELNTEINTGFNMNYAGFADSHKCEAITEETEATDIGYHGEKLLYYTVPVQDMEKYVTSPEVSNALKATKSGTSLTVTDCSPIKHEMDVRAFTWYKPNVDNNHRIASIENAIGDYDMKNGEGFYRIDHIDTDTANGIDRVYFTDGSYLVYLRYYFTRNAKEGDILHYNSWIGDRLDFYTTTKLNESEPVSGLSVERIVDGVSTIFESDENGIVHGVISSDSDITLKIDTYQDDEVCCEYIEITYNRDINKAFAELQQAIANM